MLNILILSSRPESFFANLAQDKIDALQNAGHNVTFGFDGIASYYNKPIIPTYSKIKRKFVSLKKLIQKRFGVPLLDNGYLHSDGKTMFVPYEHRPALSTESLLSRIHGSFDVVIFIFFQDMMSFETIKKIYDMYKCLVVLESIDMYTMTGGCYYFDECNNFCHECRYCPMFNGRKYSQAHRNFLYKKYVYRTTNIVTLFNTHMANYALQTTLFNKDNIQNYTFTLNENVYRTLDRRECRAMLGIPQDKFVLLMRYRSLPRKGCGYAFNAIRQFLSSLSCEQKKQIVIVTVGETTAESFDAEIIQLGILDQNGLIGAYNASSVFLSPSIDDAGPSMVNQAQACGTPVVAFKIGTALDVVIDGVSGYTASIKNVEEFAGCIKKIYDLSEEKYNELRQSTKKISLQFNSLKVYSDMIENLYEKRKNYKPKFGWINMDWFYKAKERVMENFN